MEVMPTADPYVYKVLYQADMKWNVVIRLFDDRNRKRLETTIPNAESFSLPINLKGEKSGKFTIEIATPAYDLKKEFEFIRYEEHLAQQMEIEYNRERHTIRLSTKEAAKLPFSVFVRSETGQQLIQDDVNPSGGTTMRTYNLDGAPALRFEFIVLIAGEPVMERYFDY